jgi:hypothetical protein
MPVVLPAGSAIPRIHEQCRARLEQTPFQWPRGPAAGIARNFRILEMMSGWAGIGMSSRYDTGRPFLDEALEKPLP